MTAPRDTQVPSPGIPGYPAKAGSQWLVIAVPIVELGRACCAETVQRRRELVQLLMFCVPFNQDFPFLLYICFS